MVMQTRGGQVDTDEMRAFSLYFDEVPVIALNGADWPRGRLFSAIHDSEVGWEGASVTVADALPLPFYSFDTSAFINGRRDLFRPTTFASLWDAIAKMIASQVILAVDEVKHEVKHKDDDVAKWVPAQRGLSVPLDHDIQKATKEVLAACPRLMAQNGANRNSADPFVVGLALARGGGVVTQETPANSQKRPPIPDACIAIGVPWMTLPDFVEAQAWKVTVV